MRYIFLLIFPLSLFAQNNDAACHFAVSTTASGIVEDLKGYSIPAYKHAIVRSVYEKLCNVHGDFSVKLPVCKLVRREKYGASFSFAEKQITIEEKAYDLCVSLGADSLNALASIIAHELIHFYDKHSFTASEQQKREQEWMADLRGGLLAQRAGYPVTDVQSRLINGFYDSYGLPATMKGYPARDERVVLAGRVRTQLDRLWYRYKLANYMTVTGRYEYATAYYQSLADTFSSREIYQNLSTVYALRGLEFRSKFSSDKSILFPFELDPESRLAKSAKALEDSMTMDRLEMENNLTNALNFAVQAIRLDENYVPARVNRACALMLLERFEEAGRTISEISILVPKDDKVGQALLALLRGNLMYLQKESDFEKKSAKEWTKSRDWGNRLAGVNLQLVNDTWKEGAIQLTGEAEKMDAFSIDKYLHNLDVYDYSNPLDKSMLAEIAVGAQEQRHYTGARTKDLTGSVVLIDYVDENNKSVWQYTLPGNRGQTLKGISIGSTEKMVRDQYGPPSSTVETPLGRYLHYRKSSLVFLIENGVVGEWVVYRVKGG